MKRRIFILCLAVGSAVASAQQHAKNVILFLGDAGGIPTLNVASIRTYGAPQKLFIQHMPHIALSDTSSTSSWVTDSAAGMTAIVTGHKTDNGVISELPAPAGQSDGDSVKTILEYAEEHGLSTGVITNMPIADATPAACYAHAKSRKMFGEIFSQVWKPRFGDGVDVIFGNGRKVVGDAVRELGADMDEQLKTSGRPVYKSLEEVPASARRAVVLLDGDAFKVDVATAKAIQILSKNPKGFFLMVEWDLHPTPPEKGLDNVIGLDRLVARTAKEMNPKETLVLFTADHSFDLRLISGKKGAPITLPAKSSDAKTDLAVGKNHSGEEVLVAAQGPGSERVKGFLANTDLFQIMLSAYGWSTR